MPQFRQYPQVATLDSTDAFVLDRIGVGTVFIETNDFLGDNLTAALEALDPADTLDGTEGVPVLQDGQAVLSTVNAINVAPLAALAAFVASLLAAGGSALVGFLQAGTGALRRTAQAKMRDAVAAPDYASADLGAEIGKANAYFGYAGVIGLPFGGSADATVEIDKSVTLSGRGFGSTQLDTEDGKAVGWIKADGIAGDSLVKLGPTFGAQIENTRFIGDSGARPLYALEIAGNDPSDGLPTGFFTRADNLWFGQMYALDTDPNAQFDWAIGFTHTTNNDTNALRFGRIAKMNLGGILLSNPNAGLTHFDTYNIQECPVGMDLKAPVTFTNSGCFGSTTVDYILREGAKLNGFNIVGESSAAMVNIAGNSTKFIILGGSWQADEAALVDAGGPLAGNALIVDTGNYSVGNFRLQDFALQNNTVLTLNPLMRLCRPDAAGPPTNYVIFDATWGIWPVNIDRGTLIDHGDQRWTMYWPAPINFRDMVPRDTQCLDYFNAEDRTFQAWRNDFAGKVNVFGGPLVVRRLRAPQILYYDVVGGSGTSRTYYVTSLSYGWDGTPRESDLSPSLVTSGPATRNSTHYINVNWYPINGAYGYRVYEDIAGTITRRAEVTWEETHDQTSVLGVRSPNFRDTGQAPIAGDAPTVNVTGAAMVENGVRARTQSGITAHAGGGQTLATQLNSYWARIDTCTTNHDSVRAMPAEPGCQLVIKNNTNQILDVYGWGSDTLQPPNVFYAIPFGELLVMYCFEAGKWESGPLNP